MTGPWDGLGEILAK